MIKYDYFTINFAPTVGLAFLFAFLCVNSDLDKKIKKIFFWLIGLEFIEMAAYSIELWSSTWEEPSFLRILMSALGYSIRAMLLYIIMLLPLRENKGTRLRKILTIPILINFVAAFSAFFTDIVYSYSDENFFVRGPLGFTTHFVLALYLAFIIAITVKEYRSRLRFESIIVIAIACLTMFSMMIETIYGIRSIGRTSIVLSTVFYYMFFQTEIYKTSFAKEHSIREGLEHESRTDGLTELLNKKAFTKQTQEALKETGGSSHAFVFIDLDRFKDINDTLGHIMGDNVIKDAAKKIKGIFRDDDIVGRFGGDEFCILLRNITREELCRLLDSAVIKLNNEYSKEDRTIQLTVSIGVAYRENGVAEYQQLLELADSAVYEAKRLGRNRYVLKNCD